MVDLYKYEKELYSHDITLIGGVDEVGRGPLVGPVVASCVVLPKDFVLEGLTDSKKLSEKKREIYYDYIMNHAVAIGIGIIDKDIIDKINIYEATKLAMKEAIENVRKQTKLEHVLVDAMPLELDIPVTSIIKGDALSISIAAASVIAKVTRDRMLYELDKKYPMYDFKNNKGYPTKKHIKAIEEYGIINEHRRSYGPVKDYITKHNKNNQGFTLIELLIVISILGMLAILLVPNVSSLIDKIKEENLNKIKNSIILSSKNYATDNMTTLFKTCHDKATITINDLINEDYLKGSLKNPKTKEDISLDKEIELEYNCETKKINVNIVLE